MKLYRVMDVNGDNAGFADFDDDIEAERLADKYTGYHVVEVDTVKEAAEELLAALISTRLEGASDDPEAWCWEACGVMMPMGLHEPKCVYIRGLIAKITGRRR